MLKDLIIKSLSSVKEDESYLAAEICLLIRRFDEDSETYLESNEEYWERLSDEILDQSLSSDLTVFSQNINISIQLYFIDRISLDYLVRLHGLKSIFCSSSYVMKPLSVDLGIALNLIFEFLSVSPNCSVLKEISSLFMSASLPINLGNPFDRHRKLFSIRIINENFFQSIGVDISFSENNDWFFGIFCLFACLYESSLEDIELKKIINPHLDRRSNSLTLLQNIFLSKVMYPDIPNTEIRNLEKEIKRINLSDEQKLIILNWISGNICFLNLPLSILFPNNINNLDM